MKWFVAGFFALTGALLAFYALKRRKSAKTKPHPGRHSVYYKWVISYVLFLMFSIALCISIVVNAREMILQEYEAGSESVRTVTSRLLDTYLESVYARQSQYVENETLAQLLEHEAPYDGANRYLMVKLQQQMKKYSSYLLQIDSKHQTYIYFHGTNSALSHESICTPELLMKRYHKELAVQTQELMEELNRFHFRDFVVMPQTDEGVTVLLMNSVPNNVLYKPKATVVQKLDDGFFADLLANSTKQMGMYMYLVDSQNHIISAGGSRELVAQVLNSGTLNKKQQATMTLDNGNYLVSVQNSNIPGWKYITLISSRIIGNKVSALNRSAILLGLVCLCVGVLMACFLARRQYKPVAQVIEQLSDRFECSEDANEFEMILSAFNDAEEARSNIDHLYHQQNKVIQKEFLAAALQSSFPGDAARMARALELPAQNCGYFVVLISTYGAEDNVDFLLDEAMERCIEAVENHNGRAYGLEMLASRAIVVAVDEATAQTGCSELFADILSIISSDRWEAMLLAAPSPIVQNINSINLCYQDACFTLEEKRRLKAERNPLPRTLDIGPDGHVMENTDHVAKTIVAAVHSGNVEEAEERLSQLMEACPEQISPLHYMRLAQLYSELFSTLPADCTENMEMMHASERFALRMRNTSSSGELAKILQEAIRLFGSEHARERSSTLMDKMIGCIDQHYTERDFNVSRLAELLDMNMSYLSQYFREQSGVGLLEYINRLRINRAKEIIQERKGEFTFQQVAETVGFENLNSFIRVFKKYENITPGEFRKGKNIEILG